jgi:hypothetical protein
LLSFDDVRRELVANTRLNRGARVVEVDETVGSVGRRDEFDRSFLLARASVGQRWKRIDRAFQRGEDLPPVELYETGDAYFVVDGHHRVSVARFHDVPTVDTVVAEFHPKQPVARPPAALERLAEEDRKQAEDRVVALMIRGKVYYKHLDELYPEDMPARTAANKVRTTWLKERRDVWLSREQGYGRGSL